MRIIVCTEIDEGCNIGKDCDRITSVGKNSPQFSKPLEADRRQYGRAEH
jgi:hypothetical protein